MLRLALLQLTDDDARHVDIAVRSAVLCSVYN